MRVFVAIEISKTQILENIKKFQENVKIDAKPTRTEQIHFTLQFLGEVDESIIKQLVVSIAKNNPSKIIESIEQLNVNSNFEKITDNIIHILFRIYLYIINIIYTFPLGWIHL